MAGRVFPEEGEAVNFYHTRAGWIGRGRLAAALWLALGLAAGLAAKQAEFSAQRYLDSVNYLASDKMKGRADGSKELNTAADYIANRLRRAGWQPGGDNHTFLQHFPMTIGAKLRRHNSLSLENGGGRRSYKLQQDFMPFSFSADVALEAPLVFAGYGITAPEYQYDDYQGIDAKGKIVVVLRHEPQVNDDKSVFAGKQFTTHAEIVNKAINARNHGAAGMILVNDLGNFPGEPDELTRFGTLAGPEDIKIAAVHVKAAVVDAWLKPSGQTLDGLRQAIDKDLSKHSLALDPALRLSLRVDLERIRRQVANVVAVLPGADEQLSQQAIVVGAHYDHLGLGDQHSLAPSQIGQIHHGADDNASGTSGVLELAEAVGTSGQRFSRTIVLVAFAGEESGLLGSNYYTAHPAIPLEQTLAMVNLDMIGRISKNRLFVGGTGTSPVFKQLLEEANRPLGFELSYSGTGYGASDHMSFSLRSIPVLFFFSGLHSDYHKPSDTWDKIDAQDGVRVVELVDNIVQALDKLKEKPQYVRVAEPAASGMGGGGGYGTYFGSIPDFGEIEHGVKFADVRDGSPAAKAGFKAGDILIEFDGKKIGNLYDFTYALRAHKPGDKVTVTVLRNGEKLTREVTLERRK